MPLYKRSRSHFEPEERERGAECFRAGRVDVEIDGPRARASVEGIDGQEPEVLRVGIDWSRVAERRIHIFCECRRFAGGRLCNHIWAVLLALGETGPKHQPPGKDRLGLRKDRATSWQDLAQTEKSARRPRLPRQRTPAATGQRGRAGVTSWRSHLAALSDQLSAPADHRVVKASPARSAVAIELAVNPAASLSTSGLVLDVFGRSVGASGKPGKLKRVGVEQAQ
ncbi:MAG: SWIM zinc finger family protein, partial [Thermoanaerobaculia bacterium]